MKSVLRFLSPLLALCLLSGAIWVLSKELSQYQVGDILERMSRIPIMSIVYACILGVLSYVVLTGYDYLGLKYADASLSYPKIALGSFISYSLSHNMGFAVLTGGAARLRLFTRWGVSAKGVAKLVAFVNLMFAMGFCLLAGLSFVFFQPESNYISKQAVFWVGIGFLILVLAFFIVSFRTKGPLLVAGRTIPHLPLNLAIISAVIAAIDWALIAAVAWRIFPDGVIPYADFLGIFLVAQVVSLLSHVPGGVGVFEGIVLGALSGIMPADEILGCLLVYRIIYYIIPFIGAVLCYILCELKNFRPVPGESDLEE